MNYKIKNIQDKKYNTRLYPFYKAFSWDLLFYYSISFLFLTQTKGISAAEVLFSDAFYPIFKFFFQIPAVAWVQKLGNKNSMILGNIFVTLSIAILIPAKNVNLIILSQLFSALGFIFKGVTESNLLYDSIPNTKKRNDLFSIIDGKGSAYYYYIDAICSSFTGFLFVFNAYLPIILCLTLCMLSILISCRFKEIATNQKEKKGSSVNSFTLTLHDLKQAFHFIFQSARLRSLIIFYALFSSILAILVTLRSSLLTDINFPPQYFGILFAVMGIFSGISSHNSSWFHTHLRNKTLTFLGMTISISFILLGLPIIYPINFGLCLQLLLLLFAIQYIIKGPFYTLIRRYLNSFSTPSMRAKISAATDLCSSIFRAIFTFLSSLLLGFTSTAYVCIIIGCLTTIIMTLLLDYMRHTVGLKPEQYKKKDITFIEIH